MKKTNDKSWIYTVTLFAFVLTLLFSFISEFILSGFGIILGVLVILIFIFLGVLFDMIGVATTTVSDKPFHAMAAKKVSAGKTALKMVNNCARISSFCNDVVGDVCGIMSGSAGLIVATNISNKFNVESYLIVLLMTSIIAALTIGGKALGKGYAIKYNEKIVYKVANILNKIKK
jgi:CBS domain containing-hemolysin-like protein